MSSHINTSNPINALIAIYNFGNYKSGDKEIAQALLANLRRVPDCTIESLAELCNVSVSTFQRFYKDIGYKTYAEFKIKFTEALSTHIEKNSHVSLDRQPGEDSIDALLRQAGESIGLVSASLDHARLLAFCGRSARYREIESEIPVARHKSARIGVLCMAPAFRHAEACDHLLLCKGTGKSLDMMAADLIFTALSTTYRENCL